MTIRVAFHVGLAMQDTMSGRGGPGLEEMIDGALTPHGLCVCVPYEYGAQ